jgi:MtN3 and saliva related transmembrane protein
VSETALGFVAASWGVIMALSPVLQIRRILRLRSSRDVSIGYLVVIVVGFTLWIAYGVALRNAALIVPNTLALLVGITTIAIALQFREPSRGDGDRSRERECGRTMYAGIPPCRG